MRIEIYHNAGRDYPVERRGDTKFFKAWSEYIRAALRLNVEDTIDFYEDEPGEPVEVKMDSEIETLKLRFREMSANPPTSAYAHNDRKTVSAYEAAMREMEEQLKEAGKIL